MMRQRGRGFGEKLAGLAQKGFDMADKMDIDVPDGSSVQNPFAGLSVPSSVPPGIMSQLAPSASSQPVQERQDFKDILAAAKQMTPDDVDKAVKLAQAKALMIQVDQEGARRSRSKPRHKRRAKTRRLKSSKKRTGRSNRR